ncbi:MAG: hypothetical protein AAF152_03955 [Cyanobacteria bacterium P01_A01_bin.114]
MFKETLASVPTAKFSEAIELQQIAVEFRQELENRQAFEAYCQWYAETAQKHRDELAAMQRDIPIFDWFSRSGR